MTNSNTIEHTKQDTSFISAPFGFERRSTVNTRRREESVAD